MVQLSPRILCCTSLQSLHLAKKFMPSLFAVGFVLHIFMLQAFCGKKVVTPPVQNDHWFIESRPRRTARGFSDHQEIWYDPSI
jgi:hypothetical protein